MRRRKLTTKQKFFVAEYQKDWNATRAAIRAGFSAKTAKEKGYELIHKNSLVRKALDHAISENLMKIGVHSERVLRELAKVGFSDLTELYTEEGKLKAPKDWPEEMKGAIASIQTFEEWVGKGEDRFLVGYTKKVKGHDKIKALEILAKHLGLFSGDRKAQTEDELSDAVQETPDTMLLSAKIIYLVQTAIRRQNEAKQKQMEDKPKEIEVSE